MFYQLHKPQPSEAGRLFGMVIQRPYESGKTQRGYVDGAFPYEPWSTGGRDRAYNRKINGVS